MNTPKLTLMHDHEILVAAHALATLRLVLPSEDYTEITATKAAQRIRVLSAGIIQTATTTN